MFPGLVQHNSKRAVDRQPGFSPTKSNRKELHFYDFKIFIFFVFLMLKFIIISMRWDSMETRF